MSRTSSGSVFSTSRAAGPGIVFAYLALYATSAAAYGESVHYELTRYLAISAGLKEETAREIGRADQGTDTDPATGPYQSYQARVLYHFPSASRLIAFRAEALPSCNTKQIGQYLHALEDSFAHEGYDPVVGHFPDPTPDWTHWDVPKAVNMARVKFVELGEIRKGCPQHQAGTPRLWVEIEAVVTQFLAQRKPAKLP